MPIRKKKDYSKLVYLVIVAIIVGFVYLLLKPTEDMSSVIKNKSSNNNSNPEEQATIASTPNALIIGKADAPVTLIEYYDYKCPNCGEFHIKAGEQIKQEYVDAGIVKIELRAYPFLGPDSARALRGAYCANDLGHLVDYHDNVFNHMWENYYKNGNFKVEIEDILTLEKLIEIADFENTDKTKFSECISSDVKNQFIDRDLEKAANDGVQGTPTIIIGDQKIVGPQPFNIYKQLIDIENR